MKKVMLFEPGLSTDNLGDQIIVDAVKKAFSNVLQDCFLIEFSTHVPLYNRHMQHCENADLKLICGSNLLVGNLGSYLHFRQWPVNIFTSKSLVPCVLVGVGAQKYGQKIGPYTKHIYNKILDPNYIHSVRDGFTEKQLKSNGIKNVINTGCPTMWEMTPEKCSRIATKKSSQVIFTLTDYKPDVRRDQYLIDQLRKEYSQLYFWIQGSRDFDYLKTLKNTEDITILSPTLSVYDRFLEENDNIDYVGTRLHGGMRALQHERRTIILGIDNRAIELNRDYNIPVIEMEKIKYLSEMINGEWNTNITLPVTAISKFLGQFGIEYKSEYRGI